MFPIWTPFISFSCLIALVRASSSLLNRNSKRGILVFFWSYRKCFQFFTIGMMWIVGFSYMAFLILRCISYTEVHSWRRENTSKLSHTTLTECRMKILPNYHTPHSIDAEELSGKPQHSFMIKVSTSQIQKGKFSSYQK